MAGLDQRVRALIDDRLFKAYWDSVTHFKTKDLVLFFNEMEEVDPVSAAPREKLLSDPDLPEGVRAKLQKPPSEAAVQLKSSDASFWLVAVLSDEEMVCVPVNGKAVAPGGHA